jgi:3-methyl-2-oxobutanoate hydroxymethyltransferase
MKLWNVDKIRGLKGQGKLPCVTAYDFISAKLADEAGFPLVLVGDSLGMTVLGYTSTIPVTMDVMLHHTSAVASGARDALVVADMPFMSYQVSVSEGVRNAGRFLQEGGADAVKIEGGAFRGGLVEALTMNGIPVMGHIGLTPQSVNQLGGYKVQGRSRAAVERLVEDAKTLEGGGAFSIVLECTPPDVAEAVTGGVSIPVVGIGAGPACDGQVLVLHDLLGLSQTPPPKFVRRYASLADEMRSALGAYKADDEGGRFPGGEHCYE